MSDPAPPNADDEVGKSIRLTTQDVRDAARLFRLMSGSDLGEPSPSRSHTSIQGQATYDELVARARTVLDSRQLRSRYFSPSIFGEPAWDVLLVLYITEAAGARQTIGKLADRIKIPPTTVLRWVDYLEKARLVERQPHPTDRRVAIIRILEKGRSALDDYLRAISDGIIQA